MVGSIYYCVRWFLDCSQWGESSFGRGEQRLQAADEEEARQKFREWVADNLENPSMPYSEKPSLAKVEILETAG